MTILDSGEIPRLHPDIVDTFVLDAGDVAEGTRSLTSYAKTLPPMRGLRRPDATGELPLYQPQTIGVVSDPLAVTERLLLPPDQPRPPQPEPLPTPPPGPVVYEGVRPDRYRGKRRAPRPDWAWLMVAAVTDLLVAAATTAVALAVWR